MLAGAVVLQFVAVAGWGPTCDCDYHKGGCLISAAPDVGSLCHCIYRGAWTCRGEDKACPADSQSWCCSSGADVSTRKSKDCCIEGGGDCGAYMSESENATSTSADHVIPEIAIADSEDASKKANDVTMTESGFSVQSERTEVVTEDVEEDVEDEDLDESEIDEDEAHGAGFLASSDKGCACNYQRRRAHGCKIVQAPEPTEMCQCHYKGAWTCQGYAVGCGPSDASECCRSDATEATRTSKECCVHAGSGDCDGY